MIPRARSTIRAVVFDFDGTLVDSNDIKQGAYAEVFAGCPGAPALVGRAVKGRPADDRYRIIEAVVRQLAPWRDRDPQEQAAVVRRFAAGYSRICRDRVLRARDFPGVAGTLRQLASGYRLAISSGTPERQLRDLVRARPWGRHCDPILGAPRTKHENLQRIAARYRLTPGEIVVVGDGEVDRASAASFGSAFVRVLYDRGGRRRVDEVTIRRFRDVPAAIRRLDADRVRRRSAA